MNQSKAHSETCCGPGDYDRGFFNGHHSGYQAGRREGFEAARRAAAETVLESVNRPAAMEDDAPTTTREDMTVDTNAQLDLIRANVQAIKEAGADGALDYGEELAAQVRALDAALTTGQAALPLDWHDQDGHHH